jgi:amino-acid N-acetyltransferase
MGCCSLHVSWGNLVEIRSLAVSKKYCNQGIGRQLVKACLKEARELEAGKIFVLTYKPEYFKKFGFKRINHELLPHKIWAECINCPKFPDCKEVALVKNIK